MESKILEHELLYFITWILEKNPKFRNIRSEALIGYGNTADIIVEEERAGKFEVLLIELKAYPNFTERVLKNIINQFNILRGLVSAKVNFVICFPGIISPEDEILLKKHEIEVWDLNYILERFKHEIESFPFKEFLTILFPSSSEHLEPDEDELIKTLKLINPGKAEWSKYQKHIGKILEFLFGEKLSNPIIESSDGPKINRRDFIFRNYVESGFWNYLRNQYKADFIVIDAKNYNDNIGKNEVIQIANYLKEKGTGLFGIIITRTGEKEISLSVRRDKWLLDNKMIIILNDDDIEKMILAKISSNDAEEIIKQRIEEFRLSM